MPAEEKENSMTCYDEYASEYDAWFMNNSNLLMSEVKMIARALQGAGDVLSVGCGSGLMESILKKDFGIVVKDGIEPSPGMAAIARQRGMSVVSASAEDFQVDRAFDTVMLNGCPSYIANLDAAFEHAARALKPGGRMVVADVPKESAYALVYNLAMTLGAWENPLLDGVRPPDPYPIEFVKSANWRTTQEKVSALKRCGFFDFTFCQTLTMHPLDSNRYIEEPSEGHDRGSYVAIVARRVPFLEQLKDGSLPRAAFERYVAQDVHYLRRHAETLRVLAEKLDHAEDKALFARYAEAGVATERQMLRAFASGEPVADEGWGEATLELVRNRPAAVGVAAVYPCFRTFADAGLWLKDCTGPYTSWIKTYAGAEFVAEADRVEAVLSRLAKENPELQPEMDRAVADGIRQELAYWRWADNPSGYLV